MLPLAPCPSAHAIFVVEDDADTRESLREVLGDEGYIVHTAANGREALDMLARMPPPCVILLDLMMPGMNGWQVIDALQKACDPVEIPVVIVSAYKAPAGFPVLRKPVSLDHLLQMVGRYCQPA